MFHLIFLLGSVIAIQISQKPTLEYVFEIVRHGARAPMIEDKRFAVEPS
jgi:hypothetical protein